MKRTLFHIGEELHALDEFLESIGGDISDPAVEEYVTRVFTELATDEAVKLDRYVGYIRQLEMEAVTARAEAEQYTTKARTREARVTWLKAQLKQHLELTNRTKVKTASGREISIRANGGKAPVVFLIDVAPEDLPDNLCRVTRSVDSDKVRAALESGDELVFAQLGQRGTHLRIG